MAIAIVAVAAALLVLVAATADCPLRGPPTRDECFDRVMLMLLEIDLLGYYPDMRRPRRPCTRVGRDAYCAEHGTWPAFDPVFVYPLSCDRPVCEMLHDVQCAFWCVRHIAGTPECEHRRDHSLARAQTRPWQIEASATAFDDLCTLAERGKIDMRLRQSEYMPCTGEQMAAAEAAFPGAEFRWPAEPEPDWPADAEAHWPPTAAN